MSGGIAPSGILNGGQHSSVRPGAGGMPEICPTYNVLSMDGGGIRGYSSLYILRAIMIEVYRLQYGHQTNPPTPADPKDWFDYFFGTSSGGLSAILLGRLGLTIDECLEVYKSLGHEIFAKPRRRHIGKRNPLFWHPRSKYNHQRFEKLIADFVDSRAPPPEQEVGRRNHLLEAPVDHRNRVCVFAIIDLPAASEAYHFRSYDHSLPGQPRSGRAAITEICKVARAITAAPRYFKAMDIEQKIFVDGALGHNNPTWLAHREVEQKHKRDTLTANAQHNENIISIGTGRAKPTRLVGPPGIGRYLNFLRHTTKLVSDPQNIQELLHVLSNLPGVFYQRFNVDEGLGHIELDEFRVSRNTANEPVFATLDEIKHVTLTYLEQPATRRQVRETARKIFDTVQARQHPNYPNQFPYPPPSIRENEVEPVQSSSSTAVESSHMPNGSIEPP